ncbi:peptidase inhibitor family I36 protein [Streptomyces sp. NPDC003077]|uniref:peptidase inhibitor family I36 protein n=1 Tax=Streptomyces sp. NPDC003077 TaxID=3154443 RepID=UPI0033B351A5
MNRIARKLVTVFAVAGASLGTVVLPAAQAGAQEPSYCPPVEGVCSWAAPGGQGPGRLISQDEPFSQPPTLSARNQSQSPWCFFAGPNYTGQRVQLDPSQSNPFLGFPARSVRRGPCGYGPTEVNR